MNNMPTPHMNMYKVLAKRKYIHTGLLYHTISGVTVRLIACSDHSFLKCDRVLLFCNRTRCPDGTEYTQAAQL